MSGWAARGVRLAARLLPPAVRERYREEWLADVEGARDAGVRASSIVAGALIFSATLDRTAPEISGMPLSVLAQRRARWGVALIACAAVLGVGTWINAGYASGVSSPLQTVLALAATVWQLLAIIAAVVGVVMLWRAARDSGVALASAACATGAVVAVPLGLFEPGLGTLLTPLAFVLLLASLVCGLLAWSNTPVTASAPKASTASARPALVVGFVALLAGVAFGAIELIVWSPLWMAPGFTLTEIYGALSEGDRVYGLVFIGAWIVFWTLVTLFFFIAGLVLARRDRLATRSVVLLALAILAAMVFFQFWAGFSIGNSISDTLPPYRGGRSEFGSLYGIVGQLALIGVIIGGLAPRRASTPGIVESGQTV